MSKRRFAKSDVADVAIALALFCMLASCSHRERPDRVILSYSENLDFCESCPFFKVDFQSGGQVRYECISGCAVPGIQQYSVPPQRFTDLVRAFQQEHFFDIPRTDPRVVLDAGVFRLTYRDNLRIHEVVDDARENAALTRLEARFRVAIDADRYRKPSADMYRSLVGSGWNVNTVGRDQQNALTSAVAHKDVQSARFLIQKGSVATARAVRYAAMNDNLELLRLVLPEIAIRSDSALASNAAMDAARSSNPEVLRYVLDSGASPNLREPVKPNRREPVDGLTPLRIAVENNRLENTMLLLQRGADPNAGDTYGRPPLWYAANTTNSVFIQVLLEHGANVNAADNGGETALMNATRDCYYWNMETLLKAGADPTLKNRLGKTAEDMYSLSEPNCRAAQKLIRSARNSWPAKHP